MSSTHKTGKKRRGGPYTKGELNRLIDDLIHPFYKTDKSLLLIDALLHGLIEQNPPQTVLKFLRYNLPTIINQIKAFSNSNESSNASAEMVADLSTTLGIKSRKSLAHKSTRPRKGNKNPNKVT